MFLLGIPGCGKSEVYGRVSERLKEQGLADEVQRLDDYPILWEYFQEDGPKTTPTDDGGYKILDETLWDDVLIELDQQCLDAVAGDKVVFVEFARGENLPALENFSEELLERSVILYIYCPFEEAWRRNVKRFEEKKEQGTDDHLVSREEMEETYGEDDREELMANAPVPVIRIDNDEPSLEKLERELEQKYDELAEILRKRMN